MPVATTRPAGNKSPNGRGNQLLSEVVYGRGRRLGAMHRRGYSGSRRSRAARLSDSQARFEAVPGLWIPACSTSRSKLDGKVPVVLNVNGHDRKGKAVAYKQIRCINQAKRGMLALNVEWLRMGQLHGEGFDHYRMNQLDLCGTSGLAPFYLSMKRGLDVLLEHAHADPERVAVAGLSGGGWQTI